MNNAELIAEARDVLGRVNTNAVYHDSLFQYRGGVLVRELTLIVRDLADALEAAQGAAPQADSVPTSKYISPHLPSMIRNLWKSDPSENSVRTALKLAGDLIQELIDLRAAPVQPTRTVDEAAITEVINQTIEAMPHARRLYPDIYASKVGRAVVEAIGGEGEWTGNTK